MIWPRRLRLGHCTAFPVDSYKQWSAVLHFHKARFFPGRHSEGFGTSAPGDFGIRGRLSSRRVLNGVAEDPQLALNFWNGWSSLAVAALGYESVQTSPWCSLGNANMDAIEKGTYTDFLTVTNRIFLGGNLSSSERRRQGY